MKQESYIIPRRTFLKGAGVSLALPFLDIMSPALSYAKAKAVAALENQNSPDAAAGSVRSGR